MIHFENTLYIAQPIDTVFPFVANLENVPLWNYYVVDVHKTSSGGDGTGATYHQTRKTDAQDLQIAEYAQNKVITIKTTPTSSPQFQRQMIFEAVEGGTQITDHWDLETGLSGIIEKLGAGRIRSSVAENLGKLKALLEQGSTQLQDGRVITLQD